MKTLLVHTQSMRTKFILLITVLVLISTSFSLAQRPKVGGEANDFTLVDSAGEVVSLSDLQGTPVVLNFWATWCLPCREELPFFQTTYDEINGLSDTHEMMEETAEDSGEMDTTEEAMSNEQTDEQTDEEVAEDASAEKAEQVAKKLHFVIVNNNEAAEKANAFLEEININLTALADVTKDERQALEDAGTELDKTIDVVKSYRVRGMPTTFYIDADGVIQVIKQGLITPHSMQQDLAKIGIDWQPVIEESSGG